LGDIILGLAVLGPIARATDTAEDKRSEDANDGNNNKELNKRKSLPPYGTCLMHTFMLWLNEEYVNGIR
jgi:hypothetical protein